MFEDDPDLMVMTVRVGFGTTFGCARGVCALCREARRSDKRDSKTAIGLETVTEGKGGRGNYERI